MRRLSLIVAVAAVLSSTIVAGDLLAAQSQGQSQPQVSADGRYRWHNGGWWYYTPQGKWMYHDGAKWNAYRPTVGSNYGGVNRFRRFSRGRSYYSAGPGLAPMTGLNDSFSQPVEPFKKADSKPMETNDY
ncbi:MAG TPA: hypothetical protein VHZ24_21320 [Pirellulales bacterium]|jgi:hypothetical protein|nr:hypothetical protein [Pirellulales bacterium]